jgi:hypothetical protein
MCGSCVQHLVPESIVLFFIALVIAIEGVCDNHFVAAIRASYISSELSDSSLSLPNKLEYDWILDRLAGLGGFLTDSVSIPAKFQYRV